MSVLRGRVGLFYVSKIFANISKSVSVGAARTKLQPGSIVLGRRYLYSSDILGLEGYKRQKFESASRMGMLKGQFCEGVEQYLQASEANPVFTEDMKVLVYTAETELELDLLVRMIHRFSSQSKNLRFSSFTFGPLVMRLLHIQNKPELAFTLFMDKTLSQFFNQMSSCRTLMDLLYESKQYDKLLATMDAIIRDVRIDGMKYPMDCVTIAAGACYHLDTEESLQKLVTLFKDTAQNSAIVSHRAVCYGAMLALNKKKPEIAYEMLSLIKDGENTKMPVLYFNVKVLTYVALGRLEQALNMMRGILSQDLPDHVKYRGEVFDDVLAAVGQAAAKDSVSKELKNLVASTDKHLRNGGHVPAGVKLADNIDRPIVRLRKLQDGYKKRDRPDPLYSGQRRNTFTDGRRGDAPRRTGGRPGLLD